MSLFRVLSLALLSINPVCIGIAVSVRVLFVNSVILPVRQLGCSSTWMSRDERVRVRG